MSAKFWAFAAIALLIPCGVNAGTTQLYSFETGDEGWQSATASVVFDGALGVTDGTQSARLDALTSGFKNDVLWSGNIVSGPAFDGLQEASSALAGGATDVTLEFDLAVDETNLSSVGFGQLGLFVNSTGQGFKQYGTGSFLGGNVGGGFPTVEGGALADGATITSSGAGQYHVSVPLDATLTIGSGTFYQLGFKSNGGWGGSVDLAIDNVAVSGTGIGVPEPTSLALAGLFGAAALITRRR